MDTNNFEMSATIDNTVKLKNVFIKCDICDNIKSLHCIDRHNKTKKHIANMKLATDEEKEQYKIKRNKMYEAIKKYKDKNREDINKKQRQYFRKAPKILCKTCNCKIGIYGMVAHQRTTKHIKNLEIKKCEEYTSDKKEIETHDKNKIELNNDTCKYIDFDNKINEDKGINFKIYCRCCDTYFSRRNIKVHLRTNKHKMKRELRDVENENFLNNLELFRKSFN